MQELSLDILDIAQNSVRAKAKNIVIEITADEIADRLTLSFIDDGCGMSAQQLSKVTDPFFTTRTTRKVGLGVPLFKMGAEMTGGSFEITSKEESAFPDDHGTKTVAVFGLSHIDRPPLGDVCESIHMLVTMNPDIDFVYTYKVVKKDGGGENSEFTLDTAQIRDFLGGVPVNTPEVSDYIDEFLRENTAEVNAGSVY